MTYRYASFNRPLWIGFDPGVWYKIINKTDEDMINGRMPHDVIFTNEPISDAKKYSLELTDYQELKVKNELIEYAASLMTGRDLACMKDQIWSKKVTSKEKIKHYAGKVNKTRD